MMEDKVEKIFEIVYQNILKDRSLEFLISNFYMISPRQYVKTL